MIDLDWVIEYSDLVLLVKVVDSLDLAIVYINNYGFGYIDVIIIEDGKVVEIFFV